MKGIYKDLYKYAVNCWKYQGSKEEAREDLFSGGVNTPNGSAS